MTLTLGGDPVMTPLNAALAAAAVLVLALTTIALITSARLRWHQRRVEQQAVRIARLRAELDLTRLERDIARAPRPSLAAAARSVRTKPLPRFARHPDNTPTRIAPEG